MSRKSSYADLIEHWLEQQPGPEEFVRLAEAVHTGCVRHDEVVTGFQYGLRVLRVGLLRFPSSLRLLHEFAFYASMADNNDAEALLLAAWRRRRDFVSLFLLRVLFHCNPDGLSDEELFTLVITNLPSWDKPYVSLAVQAKKRGDFRTAIDFYKAALAAHESPGDYPDKSFFLSSDEIASVKRWQREAEIRIGDAGVLQGEEDEKH